MKPRSIKKIELEALQAEFSKTDAMFLVSFRGLKVVDVDDLRKRVRDAQGSYRVVKNTLARAASKGTVAEALSEEFTGPTAIVTAAESVPPVAKVLVDYAKDNKAVEVRCGVVSGDVVNAAQVEELADIPPFEVLQARLAGVLQAPLQRLASVLAAPSRNLAVVLGQVAEKQDDGGGEG